MFKVKVYNKIDQHHKWARGNYTGRLMDCSQSVFTSKDL